MIGNKNITKTKKIVNKLDSLNKYVLISHSYRHIRKRKVTFITFPLCLTEIIAFFQLSQLSNITFSFLRLILIPSVFS